MSLKAEISKGTVEHILKGQEELSHLKVRTRGDLLIIESVDTYGNVCPHARFKKRSVHVWDLQMPTRKGWEPIFIEGTATELTNLLIEKFPWALAPQ
ncbi:MAG: hypothetical protein ACREHG_11255 [Candidatus Saccharimonadales bacterium]